ncbi:hypothetical protein [Vibrio sp. THAF190c]|uniref:hypothetical protein n=1 Tax=Vibrio sp. THAF190c TaxID=2587865 RepID=UPI001267E6D0|nr:hypothetical protein [Vibrio sp. THAF190c]QFT13416.1 hypothetical protein FIV04_26035 [Vibrio sp. THAF190c]
MPVKAVLLHKSFFQGMTNNCYFVDYQNLSDEHLDLLMDFVDDVIDGNKLKGRNKPSWHDKDGKDIPKAKAYKQCKVWHYHAGPHADDADYKTLNVRQPNYEDYTSDAVIHYSWLGEQQDKIVILGFSPQHKKFPLPSDKGNPLRSRMGLKGRFPDSVLEKFRSNDDKEDLKAS